MNYLKKWKLTRKQEDAEICNECILDIQVLDPAKGSGHFLVTAVDEITKWIMSILQRHPDAPLAQEIGYDRTKIISEQRKKGITLDEDLLSFNVILKRRALKYYDKFGEISRD